MSYYPHPRKDIPMEFTLKKEIKRIILVLIAAILTAINIKTFVRTGGLVPGGFNGLTLLLQRSCYQFFQISLPFTVINFSLNAIPVIISFKMLGKRFTLYSCLMIFLTGILTDIIPANPLTYDILLISVFGGILNGFAVSLCLIGGATSGGTDFIAIFLSERYKIDTWYHILMANAVMLMIAGFLFGWDKALYSIIFQFASTQVVHTLHLRYKKHTLFIVTDHPNEVYGAIKECTHHSATILNGTGCYQHQQHSVVYSIVSSDEVKLVLSKIHSADPKAFINVIKTDQLEGRFYHKPTE